MLLQGSNKYPVREVVLHCAAVHSNWHRGKTAADAVAEIDAWHKERGWKGFGYHGLFMPDGSFHPGRPYSEIGSHVLNHNRGKLGFIMIERAEITNITVFHDWFTEARRIAVRTKLKEIEGISIVSGHNDYAKRLCPGFRVKTREWLW